MSPLKLTIGSDPELVIVDKKGHPVSALRVLKTTKDKPIELGDGIRIYADNVLAEAAFTPVTLDKIVERIHQVLRRMKMALGDYSILPQAAITFPKKELDVELKDEDGEIYASAWEIGCNANFGAYRPLADLINPKLNFTDGIRTGSFHIHVGNADWENGKDDRLMTMASKIEAIKLMDLYVGASSIVWDNDASAPVRRKYYGKAGEFRPTKYGIEYRVLGNYALTCPHLVEMVFELVRLAMRHIEDGTGAALLKQFDAEDTIHAINENNHTTASDIVDGLDIDAGLKRDIFTYSPSSTDMAKNWGF